jgi:peptidoglycan pentaglycine glycine transferase (the first glycine)
MKESLFQSKIWGEFQEKLPSRGKYWAAQVDGGRATVVRHKLPLGLCWLGIERGPILERAEVWENLWKEILKIAQTEKAVFVRIEPAEGDNLDYLSAKWRPAHAHYQPEWTLRVNLEGSEEEILAQMKPKGRYNIRVAKKKGVTVREGTSTKDVADFYGILQKTGSRDGFHIHGGDFYQRFVEEATQGDWGKLYLAEHEGKVIGGIIATFYGDTGTYYYGASDHEFRAVMAPYLLQWTALNEAKSRNCKWYDFLGIAPPDEPKHVWAGITQFKTKFGGEKLSYGKAREFVLRPIWFNLMRLKKRFN